MEILWETSMLDVWICYVFQKKIADCTYAACKTCMQGWLGNGQSIRDRSILSLWSLVQLAYVEQSWRYIIAWTVSKMTTLCIFSYWIIHFGNLILFVSLKNNREKCWNYNVLSEQISQEKVSVKICLIWVNLKKIKNETFVRVKLHQRRPKQIIAWENCWRYEKC